MTTLDYSTFKPLVNTTFTVKLNEPSADSLETVETSIDLELVSAEEKENTQCESFSLIFHGPATRLLRQKIYTFHHDTLGEQQICIVPVGENTEGEAAAKKTTGYQYQAVFSRLKE